MLRTRSFDLVSRAVDHDNNKFPKLKGSIGGNLHDLEQDRAIRTDPDETRKRRTIKLIRQKGQSWGFTLQTYGIRNKRTRQVEIMSYVDYVEIEGPAWVAGMRRGVIILSVNGESVEPCTHRELVRKIQSSGCELRLVVLFDDCCHKVELHERYIRLKRLLSQKVKELRGLEAEEKKISQGIPLSRLDSFRQSTYSSSSSDWDTYSEITSPSVYDSVPVNRFAFRENYSQSASDISAESSDNSIDSLTPDSSFPIPDGEDRDFSRSTLVDKEGNSFFRYSLHKADNITKSNSMFSQEECGRFPQSNLVEVQDSGLSRSSLELVDDSRLSISSLEMGEDGNLQNGVKRNEGGNVFLNEEKVEKHTGLTCDLEQIHQDDGVPEDGDGQKFLGSKSSGSEYFLSDCAQLSPDMLHCLMTPGSPNDCSRSRSQSFLFEEESSRNLVLAAESEAKNITPHQRLAISPSRREEVPAVHTSGCGDNWRPDVLDMELCKETSVESVELCKKQAVFACGCHVSSPAEASAVYITDSGQEVSKSCGCTSSGFSLDVVICGAYKHDTVDSSSSHMCQELVSGHVCQDSQLSSWHVSGNSQYGFQMSRKMEDDPNMVTTNLTVPSQLLTNSTSAAPPQVVSTQAECTDSADVSNKKKLINGVLVNDRNYSTRL